MTPAGPTVVVLRIVVIGDVVGAVVADFGVVFVVVVLEVPAVMQCLTKMDPFLSSTGAAMPVPW